jgi:predicted transcriptional regulator
LDKAIFKTKFVKMNAIMSAAKPLDQEITHYLGHLNVQQKKVVLSVVKTFAQEESDWWEGVEEAAQESIERGLKQAEEGKVKPHKEVMKKYKKWLSK